jgi:DNA-binding transcriptional regulator YiaG
MTIDRVKDLYTIICNGQLGDRIDERVAVIEELERLTSSEFKSNSDFHRKVSEFILRGDGPGSRLRALRKAKRWTLEVLGIHLGCSRQFVEAMERGRKPLTERAMAFVEAQKSYPPILPYAGG